MKIKDRIAALRRQYPKIGRGRYLYARSSDLAKRGHKVKVYALMWSDDGQVSLHATVFEKGERWSVVQWADWLILNGPNVYANQVLAYVNRTTGSEWRIDRVFGWHFTA